MKLQILATILGTAACGLFVRQPPQASATKQASHAKTLAPFVELDTYDVCFHSYALTGSVTDLRRTGKGLFLIGLEMLSKSDRAGLSGFVEAVTPQKVELQINDKLAKIPFFKLGNRIVAFVDASRLPRGTTVTLTAWGKTTKSYLGHAPGMNEIFGSSFTIR